MSRRNWVNLFSSNEPLELSNDLERGYEAALLIQSLELEYYGDRQVRPELELAVPRSVQATILRRFRTALSICRDSLAKVEPNRGSAERRTLCRDLCSVCSTRFGGNLILHPSRTLSLDSVAAGTALWFHSECCFCSCWFPYSFNKWQERI